MVLGRGDGLSRPCFRADIEITVVSWFLAISSLCALMPVMMKSSVQDGSYLAIIKSKYKNIPQRRDEAEDSRQCPFVELRI